ncbi:MAG: succinate dehydrogenase cytochrome b subunit [Chitinophagaceae bacterium]
MDWKQFFTSAVGKKVIMAFTGFFLISFLVVHCTINSCIFLNDHGQTFNQVAHFMGTNWIVHFMELGLFLGIILHIVQGLLLWNSNQKKRPIPYSLNRPQENSKWYSRSMGLLGTLLLIFLIIHLSNFWAPNRYNYIFHGHEDNLFQKMKLVFSHGWLVILYLLGLISLSFHLLHGFQSAFRTFGLNSKRYVPIIRGIGTVFSILVPVLFALMPVLIYFQVIQ